MAVKTIDFVSVEDILGHAAQVVPSEGRVEVGAGGAGASAGRQLLRAARAGDQSAVSALLANGAPFAADWLGTSPLHQAAMGDHAQVIRALLKAGVSRDAKTKVDRTALHVAASEGAVNATEALIEGGSDVKARDMLRMTPLHWAARRGHTAIAKLLLEAGAPPAIRDKFGLTPRQLAARAGHAAIVQMLDAALAAPAAPETESQQQSEPVQVEDTTPAEPVEAGLPQAETLDPPLGRQSAAGAGAGAALLERHGITLLPRDDTPTVLRALRGGRTLVLSDAGKLLLKESCMPAPMPPPGGGGSGGSGSGSVVVKATKTRAPPTTGGKVFTLTTAATSTATATSDKVKRKVIHPRDLQLDGGTRGVKLVMNRANFRRLMSVTVQPTAGTQPTEQIYTEEETDQQMVDTDYAMDTHHEPQLEPEPEPEPEPTSSLSGASTQSLVTQLLQARGAVQRARAMLEEAERAVQEAEAELRNRGLALPDTH